LRRGRGQQTIVCRITTSQLDFNEGRELGGDPHDLAHSDVRERLFEIRVGVVEMLM